MKHLALTLGMLFLTMELNFVFASNPTTKDTLNYSKSNSKKYFFQAKEELENMLSGKSTLSYERAVFITENAYWDNSISDSIFTKSIDFHTARILNLITTLKSSDTSKFRTSLLLTAEEKKEKFEKAKLNWAIYTYMTDTTYFVDRSHTVLIHYPYEYSSKDPLGSENWGNSQVFNLLDIYKQKGNCYAMTSLFKILSERLKTDASIVTAPGHVFIQHEDLKGTIFNIELATRSFPGTGSIETLTYSTDKAIKNGLSMRAMDLKQSIAMCLIYLAKGYEHKFGINDDDFILSCANSTLKFDSSNLNAMLLKREVMEERLIKSMTKNKITSVTQISLDASVNKNFKEYENFVSNLYSNGYKEMPLEMKNILISRLRDENYPIFLTNHTPQPFKNIGVKDSRYATLSNGIFDEMILDKPIEKISRTVFDTKTGKIKEFTACDSTYNNYKIDPVVFAWSVDPLANHFANWSPYVAFADNPIYYVDPDGKKFVNFDAAGNYVSTTKDNWFHNLFVGSKGRILDAQGAETRRFSFADPKHDVADIQSGVITKLVVVDEKDIFKMMARSGAFDSENKTANKPLSDRYDYIMEEGKGGGKMDFSYTSIPDVFPGASRDPLNSPSPMIFLVDDYAHNQMNFGNFMFGASGYALGYSKIELLMGAHYNSLANSPTNGYTPQFDSSDDQFSIQLGVGHSYNKDYRSVETKIEVGPLSPGTVCPDECEE